MSAMSPGACWTGTRWTEIAAAQRGDDVALRALALRYRPPVVAYLARRGLGAEAEDLAQEVFIRLFAGGVLDRADAAQGRFRDLLLAVTRHVLGNHVEHELARKRGADRTVPLGNLDVAAREPDDDFDREWVGHLLALALERLASEQPSYHAVLQRFLVEEQSYREIAAALGCSLDQVKNAVYRAKRKLVGYLQEEVGAYTASHAEWTQEVQHLARFLHL